MKPVTINYNIKARYFILWIVLVLSGLNECSAQTNRMDSLHEIMLGMSPSSGRLSTLLEYLEYAPNLHRDTFYHYAAEAYHLSKKTGNKEQQGRATIAFANSYLQWGWVDSAEHFLKLSLQDSMLLSKRLWFESKRQLALVYGSTYRNNDALAILLRNCQQAKTEKDNYSLSASANSIVSVLLSGNEFNEALNWILQAESAAPDEPSLQHYYLKAAVYTNKAGLLLETGKTQAAFKAMEEARKWLEKEPNLKVSSFLERHYALYLLKTGKMAEAEAAIKIMTGIQQALGSSGIFIDDNLAIARFYSEAGYKQQAIELCEKFLSQGNTYSVSTDSVAVFNNNAKTRLPYYELLAQLYKQTGQSAKYTAVLENLVVAKDSFYLSNKAEEMAALQARYQLSEQERMLAIKNLDLLRKDFLLWSVAIIGIISIGYLVFRFEKFRKSKQKQLEKAIRDAARQAELDRLASMESERKRIAADLHDNLGAYSAALRNSFHLTKNNKDSEGLYVEMESHVQHMVEELGNTIWVLNKSEKNILELFDKLKSWVNKLLVSYPQIKSGFSEEGEGNPEMSPAQSLQWLYILQEGINNSVRHSNADIIAISLKLKGNNWRVSVLDNGKGMPDDIQYGNGMMSMKSRAEKMGWQCNWNQPADGVGTRFILQNQVF